MRFFAHHGVQRAERDLGQLFIVDLRVGTCLKTAGRSDSLQDTIDYAAVHRLVKNEFESYPHRNLVEKLAENIAASILHEYPAAMDVRIAVTKPHVSIPHVDAFGVEIYRNRDSSNGMQ